MVLIESDVSADKVMGVLRTLGTPHDAPVKSWNCQFSGDGGRKVGKRLRPVIPL